MDIKKIVMIAGALGAGYFLFMRTSTKNAFKKVDNGAGTMIKVYTNDACDSLGGYIAGKDYGDEYFECVKHEGGTFSFA
jgi:hypothetical protein